MKEEFNPSENTQARTPQCERAADLVAYLYGEASAAEAQSFSQHMDACAACRAEFADFSVVREAVGAWRGEALSIAPSLAFEEPLAPGQGVRAATLRQRSALAALREFFALSPMWLRAGALAASLIVCALCALTLARTEIRWDADGFAFRAGVSRERVVTRTVEVPSADTFTRRQVDEMIKGEVARTRDEVRAEIDARGTERQPAIVTAGDSTKGKRAVTTSDAAPTRAAKRAGNSRAHNAPRASNQVAGVEEEEAATSLYDLLRVVN